MFLVGATLVVALLLIAIIKGGDKPRPYVI
jgi:hypothetical protein